MRVSSLADLRARGELRWFEPALERIAALRADPDPARSSYLDLTRPLLIGRAPGRLDLMGGIADYSGADVLELPLACSTWAALQAREGSGAQILTRRAGRWDSFECELASLKTSAGLLAGRFSATDRWAAYPVGVLYRCLCLAPHAETGFRLLLDSTVPEGKGVASSAALEVAALSVLAAHFGVELSPEQLALECQWAENHVVRAPCGLMDQMTSVLGRQNRLLALRCQPGGAVSHLAVPAGYRCYGIDSGIRHAVSGADYGTVRTAAFMGYGMIAAAAGLSGTVTGGQLRIHDPRWNGFLCNLTPEEFGEFESELPTTVSGADFLKQYGGITDPVTRVDPALSYPVRAATSHPIQEQQRVRRFAELLGTLPREASNARELGELMYASHRSYSACGLGSDGTDRLVELVAEAGPERGLFGAKITGGGSGGTVAIFGREAAEPLVHDLASRYTAESGHGGTVFAESGPGAAETGLLSLAAGELQ